MYCTKCGATLQPSDRFCPSCGAPTAPGYTAPGAAPPEAPRLVRPIREKKIAGVCAGFAHYFDVDVSLMRILWLAMVIISGGAGLLVYLAAWIIMPADRGTAPYGM